MQFINNSKNSLVLMLVLVAAALAMTMVASAHEVDAAGGSLPPPPPPPNSPPPPPPPMPEFRSIDGSGNNKNKVPWGSAGTPFARRVGATYAPQSAMRPGPNARSISNAVLQQGIDPATGDAAEFEMANEVSGMLWQWGQFLDHDITQTSSSAAAADSLAISVLDTADRLYPTIPFTRDDYVLRNGNREQINHITSFIDASMVYGSDAARAKELRTLSQGLMKTTASAHGPLLPFNVNGFDNAPAASLKNYFLAGDVRANEQSGLTAMHVLFVREHNRLAGLIAQQSNIASITDAVKRDETIYQLARRIVGAQIQRITYKEFLPILIGDDLSSVPGYNSNQDPSITNEFAAAAYRVGHTTLSDALPIMEATDTEPQEPPLTNFFFDTTEILTNGPDRVLRGLANYPSEEVDLHIADSVRTFLFEFVSGAAPGLDLAALNIQRGRDHGLPTYNQVRRALGLPPAQTYADIAGGDATNAANLLAAYGAGNVEAVDLWVGGLAEPHVPGAAVGPTFKRIIQNQFAALKAGDRLFYEWANLNQFEQSQLRPLAKIIQDNTNVVFTTNDVFHRP